MTQKDKKIRMIIAAAVVAVLIVFGVLTYQSFNERGGATEGPAATAESTAGL